MSWIGGGVGPACLCTLVKAQSNRVQPLMIILIIRNKRVVASTLFRNDEMRPA